MTSRLGWNLNREEAVAVSKEAVTLLQNHDVTAIKLSEAAEDPAFGFQVRIQAFFDKQAATAITQLSEKKGLSVKFLDDEAVIF